MNNSFQFKYELREPGTAYASFASNDVFINFNLTNICNPLFELLEGLFGIVSNPKHIWGERNEIQITWLCTNNTYNWHFHLKGENDLTVIITQSTDFFESDGDTIEVAHFECKVFDFVFCIINELDSFIKKTGLLNYVQHWKNGTFPFTYFLFLKKYLIDNNAWTTNDHKQCDSLSDEILLLMA